MANLAFNRIHVMGASDRLEEVEAFVNALPEQNLYSMLDTWVTRLDDGSIEVRYASKWEIEEGPCWAIEEKVPDVEVEYECEGAPIPSVPDQRFNLTWLHGAPTPRTRVAFDPACRGRRATRSTGRHRIAVGDDGRLHRRNDHVIELSARPAPHSGGVSQGGAAWTSGDRRLGAAADAGVVHLTDHASAVDALPVAAPSDSVGAASASCRAHTRCEHLKAHPVPRRHAVSCDTPQHGRGTGCRFTLTRRSRSREGAGSSS